MAAQWRRVLQRWKASQELFALKPLQFLSIPIIAAGVGYFTNYLGVNMLFYPLEDKYSFKRWPDQPLGLFGWQGIVPCKRVTMATTLVDVSLTKLIRISEIFERLDSGELADILKKNMSECVLGGVVPVFVVRHLLDMVAKAIIRDIEDIVSIKDIVVDGLTTDPSVLGKFFMEVGKKELEYLINSGTYFGFLLGLLQMIQLMLFPANWTLPICGAMVGFMTNWLALQLIFKPVEPFKVMWNDRVMLTIQGFCLARQQEVSVSFSEYIASHVLTSEKMWKEILHGKGDGQRLRNVITTTLPIIPNSLVDAIMTTLEADLIANPEPTGQPHPKHTLTHLRSSHPLHAYINRTMNLEDTLIGRMNLLTPTEFERILHPIFEEDELTLIVAGGILGFVSGCLQWWVKVAYEKFNTNAGITRTGSSSASGGCTRGEYRLHRYGRKITSRSISTSPLVSQITGPLKLFKRIIFRK